MEHVPDGVGRIEGADLCTILAEPLKEAADAVHLVRQLLQAQRLVATDADRGGDGARVYVEAEIQKDKGLLLLRLAS